MSIPRIIHQTWKSERLPTRFRTFQDSWRRHHPNWDYRFYDDDACRQVVADAFPGLLPMYDRCPHPVQRADIFRYLVVAHEGGLYADMDMECLRPVDQLLEGRRAVFGVEDFLSARRARRLDLRHRERIANFIFAAEAGHPIFREIVAWLEELPGPWDMEREVLETTGPGMLTNLVQDHRETMFLTTLPRIFWASPDWRFWKVVPRHRRIHARHHFAGTWKDSHGRALRTEVAEA